MWVIISWGSHERGDLGQLQHPIKPQQESHYASHRDTCSELGSLAHCDEKLNRNAQSGTGLYMTAWHRGIRAPFKHPLYYAAGLRTVIIADI